MNSNDINNIANGLKAAIGLPANPDLETIIEYPWKSTSMMGLLVSEIKRLRKELKDKNALLNRSER